MNKQAALRVLIKVAQEKTQPGMSRQAEFDWDSVLRSIKNHIMENKDQYIKYGLTGIGGGLIGGLLGGRRGFWTGLLGTPALLYGGEKAYDWYNKRRTQEVSQSTESTDPTVY